MRADTKKRKNATQMLRATQEQEWWADQVVHVMLEGKRALDAAMLDVGRLVAETLMYNLVKDYRSLSHTKWGDVPPDVEFGVAAAPWPA